ncbi:MAG: hypothetical protein QM765_37150 [Myxococcales bacterium]
MKRALLIVLLSFGTVAGYASGFHHLRHGGCHGWQSSSCPCQREASPQPASPPPSAPAAQPKAPESPPPAAP